MRRIISGNLLCSIIGASLLVVGAFAGYSLALFSSSQRVSDQANSLAVQAQCANRAEQVFKQQMGDTNSTVTQHDETNSYTNHWNQQLGKCFVLIDSRWSAEINGTFTLFIDKTLLDAFEGHLYGEFSSNGPGMLDGEQEISGCRMYRTGDGLNATSQGQQCKSEAEFDSYTSSLMGN